MPPGSILIAWQGTRPGRLGSALVKFRSAKPRLDNSTGTATNWFLFTDPALIDTLEYCCLEGQQGVYIETRQGFEVDGVEIKARMDFGAAAIDYRGLQKSAGA
jgi:hypothetical protein